MAIVFGRGGLGMGRCGLLPWGGGSSSSLPSKLSSLESCGGAFLDLDPGIGAAGIFFFSSSSSTSSSLSLSSDDDEDGLA